MRIVLTTALLLGAASSTALAGSFTPLTGAEGGYVNGLSRNGRIVAGSYVAGGQFAGSYVWRLGAGVSASPLSPALGMNSWAQPIAGGSLDDDGNVIAAEAFSDVDITGPVMIGPYPGSSSQDGFYSTAYGVSDNGIAVGLAFDPSYNPIAFRWTAAEGMTRLAVNRPTTYSRANGISADGSTPYGWNDRLDGYRRGVIWVDGKPVEPHNYGAYGDSFGSPPGEALGSNSSGSVIVGQGFWNELFQSLAWRWTSVTDAQPIGIIYPPPPSEPVREAMAKLQPPTGLNADGRYKPYGFFVQPASYALGVTDDGNTIVGNTSDGNYVAAFIWTATDGMVLLSDYAAAHNIDIPAGYYLLSADKITPDGSTIAGIAIDPTNSFVIPWVMNLNPPDTRGTTVLAQGTVISNDLPSGPMQPMPVGSAVSMEFTVAPDGAQVTPGRESAYPLLMNRFVLTANYQDPVTFERITAVEDLDPASAPDFHLINDDPRRDGVDLPETPTATPGQTLQFTLSNPTGVLFDSDQASHINRSFDPSQFDSRIWVIRDGAQSMQIALQFVTLRDDADTIFANGFDSPL